MPRFQFVRHFHGPNMANDFVRSAECRVSGRQTSRPSGSGSVVRSALRASSALKSRTKPVFLFFLPDPSLSLCDVVLPSLHGERLLFSLHRLCADVRVRKVAS
eukprot:4961055-Prymnesium_polylepis.1